MHDVYAWFSDASESVPEIESEENNPEIREHPEETATIDKYTIPELSNIPQVHDEVAEEVPTNEPISLIADTSNHQEQLSLPVDEPIREPPKLTYASIVCIMFKEFAFFVISRALDLQFFYFLNVSYVRPEVIVEFLLKVKLLSLKLMWIVFSSQKDP